MIEMTVTIAVSCVLLGIATSAILLMFRAEERSRTHARQRGQLERLARQFREDVHAATNVTEVKAPAGQAVGGGWDMSGSDGKPAVQYRRTEGGLTRTVNNGGQAAQRETYSLPPSATVAIEPATPAVGAIATLLIRPAIAATASAEPADFSQPLRVEAILGWDHRFEKER